MFLDIYEKAVKDIVAQKWVRLSVSDSDAVFATSHSDQLLGMVSGAERINIKVLDNAPKGSCIVETAEKIVDSGIDTQLSFLKTIYISRPAPANPHSITLFCVLS
ncbi:MAG TPA: hypothetical protein DD733_12600 [Clostridiales bacterium]|nr:hypothetical protein [Clostridiales bacterium]